MNDSHTRSHDIGDGHRIDVQAFGRPGGPVLSVLGGVHGDELEGVVAARALIEYLREREASLRGQVRIVPVSNPPAFAARRRTSPIDGANLARVFPGSEHGSITERAAAVITAEVIAGSDVLVDLHSAGADYVMPVFAGCVVGGDVAARSLEATYAFGAPVVWEHDGSGPGRSLSAAFDLNVPSIYVEGSGGGGLVGHDLDVYVHGLHRLLAWLGILDSPLDPPVPPIVLRGGDGDVDASLSCGVGGFCITRVHPGQVIASGDLIAEIVDDRGRTAEEVRARRDGTVMMLRRRADVAAGDGIAMMGPTPAAHAGPGVGGY